MDWRHLGAETPYYKLKFGKNFSNAVGIQLSAAATDAGEIRIPAGKDKGKVLNDDGIYDYYEESSYEEHSVWKKKIGAFVLGWLLHPSVVPGIELCILKSFPPGYKLYTHHKITAEEHRKDHYLLGSSIVTQFRSPEEFLLHFRWLITGKPMNEDDEPDCLCTYCSGTPQREISAKYANYRPREPTSGNGSSDEDKKKKSVSGKAKHSPLPPMQIKDYRHLAVSTSTLSPSSAPPPEQIFASSTSTPSPTNIAWDP